MFTSGQAAAVGVPSKALYQAMERGWLRRVRRGVYAFAGRLPFQWESIVAVALAAGPDAVISHAAAAAIHGFWGIARPRPELTVPNRNGRLIQGAKLHRSTEMLPKDLHVRGAVRLTAPIRTLIDSAPAINDYLLPRVIDEGSIQRLWTPEQIADRLDEMGRPGHRGTFRLRGYLEARMGEGNPADVLEQRVIRAVKPHVPPFQIHHLVELDGRLIEMDMAWVEYFVNGEIEGRYIRMASRTKFDSDRERSNLLQRHGWRQVHFTATMDDATLLAQVVPFFPREVIDPRIWAEAHRGRR
jgi:hypothetical protein